MPHYTPPPELLAKYANVLVNFALNNGQPLKPNAVVQIAVPDVAKPLAHELYKTVLQAGGHPLLRLAPTGFERSFYTLANKQQRTFFPEAYYKARTDLLDHAISIIADTDPNELTDIDSSTIMQHRQAVYPYREWLFAKEHKNQFSWTLGLWGTPAKAAIVGLSLEDYWQQIVNACFLDHDDPISQWQNINTKQQAVKDWLNQLPIETIRVVGPDVDLTVRIGPMRTWKTGSGCNIPSFEHFTSPDWRGTEGWISFNQPLYQYGTIITGIRLEFSGGKVIKATAKTGQKVLRDMIATKNADKVGEFSLTDKRFSRITHPMAETLYDENIGGPNGNMHIALGMAYKDCFIGTASEIDDAKWEEMGYNNSAIHTDIVTTAPRTATATLTNGSTVVIYANGQFQHDA